MKFLTIFDPKSDINFVGMYKISGILGVAIPLATLLAFLFFGMPWGIDFSGGVEMQVKFSKPVSANEIREVLSKIDFDKSQVQQYGVAQNNEMLIRVERMASLQDKDVEHIRSLINSNFTLSNNAENIKDRILFDKKSGSQLSIWLDEPTSADLTDPLAHKQQLEAQKQKLLDLLINQGRVELRRTSTSTDDKPDFSNAIMEDYPQNGLVRYTVFFSGISGKIKESLEQHFGQVEIRRVDFVDSQVSHQLRTDGLWAVIYAVLAIALYIAIRFDMYFSPGALFTLINDTMGALLVFVIGRVEFDTPSIAALLTIVGYSVNNTVVIYDRIRENLPANPKKPLTVDELKPYVNKAINDTMSRTINTTITTLFASIAIWVFASGSIKNFAMVLTVGITCGAFSSVFIAPAVYLLAKKYLTPAQDKEIGESTRGHSHEDKAKGIV